MGFILLLLHHEKWKRLYFDNCTLLSTQEWNAYGASNHVSIGILYMSLGIVFEILYIPFMIAMLKPEFIQHSCYKFMFLLGCIDMAALPANSIIAGIQAILSLHYCSNPTLFYVVGCMCQICYLGASITCALLAINRFFEILFPEVAKILYSKPMMLLWYSIAIGYMISMWFNAPTFFSIIYLANYLDPFKGIEGFGENSVFYGSTNRYLLINSGVVILGCGIPYTTLCVFMTIKSKLYQSTHMTKLQRVMLLQSLAICLEMFIVATVYQWNQYFWVPDFVVKLENITWYCVHGDIPIVYLLLNESLRKKFFQMLRDYTKKTASNVIEYVTSVYPIRIHPHVQDERTDMPSSYQVS